MGVSWVYCKEFCLANTLCVCYSNKLKSSKKPGHQSSLTDILLKSKVLDMPHITPFRPREQRTGQTERQLEPRCCRPGITLSQQPTGLISMTLQFASTSWCAVPELCCIAEEAGQGCSTPCTLQTNSCSLSKVSLTCTPRQAITHPRWHLFLFLTPYILHRQQQPTTTHIQHFVPHCELKHD